MMELKIKNGAVVASLVGLALMLWYLRHAPVGAIVWNCVPYVGTLLAALVMRRALAIMGGIVAMLVVDGWIVFESALHTESSVLLAVSLLSTVKLIIVFPLGLMVGYAIDSKQELNK